MSANLQFLVLIIKCNQLPWPPSALPSPVCPPPPTVQPPAPTQLSAALWSDHRAGDYSRLSCPQDDRPNSRRPEHREPTSASESAEHMPFSKKPEGLAAITHLANTTGRGFILWATLDRIISLYSARQQGLDIVRGQPPPALLIY